MAEYYDELFKLCGFEDDEIEAVIRSAADRLYYCTFLL